MTDIHKVKLWESINKTAAYLELNVKHDGAEMQILNKTGKILFVGYDLSAMSGWLSGWMAGREVT